MGGVGRWRTERWPLFCEGVGGCKSTSVREEIFRTTRTRVVTLGFNIQSECLVVSDGAESYIEGQYMTSPTSEGVDMH